MKTEKGYKVVLRYGNGLMSITSSSGLIYKPLKKVKRQEKCGPLAVFEDLSSVRSFVRWNWGKSHAQLKNVRVFRVKYVPSKNTSLWEYYPASNLQSLPVGEDTLPLGTRFADSVVLLTQVKKSRWLNTK